MNIDELQAFHNSIVSITKIARDSENVYVNGRNLKIDDLGDKADSQLKNIGKKAKPKKIDMSGFIPESKEKIRGYFASTIKLTSILATLDGGKQNGFFQKYVLYPLHNVVAEHVNRSAEYAAAYQKIADKNELSITHLKEKRYYKGINQSISGEYRIGIAAHFRNSDNSTKLIAGYNKELGANFNEETFDEILNDLSANEIAFINDVGDLLETLFPEVAALNRRIQGVTLNKITGESRRLKNGVLLGGYWPIKLNYNYDTYVVGDITKSIYQAEVDEQNRGMSGLKQYSPKHTSRNSRVDFHAHPIRVDLGIIGSHISETLQDITHTEFLMDTRKIMNSEKVSAAGINRLNTLSAEIGIFKHLLSSSFLSCIIIIAESKADSIDSW